VYTIIPDILVFATKSACCRFHAQRFYALNCLATKDPNATPIKADITLNMMLIEMPVAKAEEFHQHVQVSTFLCIVALPEIPYIHQQDASAHCFYEVLLVYAFAIDMTANNMRHPLKVDLKYACQLEPLMTSC